MNKKHTNLIRQISQISQINGDYIALADNKRQINYEELEKLTNSFAYKISEFKYKDNKLVAIYLPRGVDVVIALLSVLKVNLFYTIIEEDEGNIEEHILRLQTINPCLIITNLNRKNQICNLNIPIINIESIKKFEPNCNVFEYPEINTKDIVYTIFTSGSTGKPKGVIITHENINHYTKSILSALSINTPLNYLHASTFSADLGNTCLFLSLWTGGTLHIMSNEIRKNPIAFFDYTFLHKIDVIKLTPTHWSGLSIGLQEDLRSKIQFKFLILGGELLSSKLAKEIIKSKITLKLINHYGPTETTIGVMIFSVDENYDFKNKSIPIGKVIGSTRIAIKNKNGLYNALNEEGELYIAGPSVGKGYLNEPLLTAKKFIYINEISPKIIFYKTGDRVKLNAEGNIEFISRIDRQVKINGYRVELGYIENVIEKLNHAKQVFVNYIKFYNKFILVAAIIPNKKILHKDILIEDLRKKLPSYMVPHHIIYFDVFPFNNNGKINIDKINSSILIKLKQMINAENQDKLQEHDEMSEMIYQIWIKYLKHKHFGIDDSFYQLGGNSMDIIMILSELQIKGYPLSTHHLPKEVTIRNLVKKIKITKAREHNSIRTQKINNGSYQLSSAQKWFFNKNFKEPSHWNQAMLLETTASIEVKHLKQSIDILIKKHPMLLVSYFKKNGDYQYKPTLVNETEYFTTSNCKNLNQDEVSAHILEVSEKIQKKILINEGKIFKAHLFQLENSNQLLLMCHHLSIDLISWNIIISDLIYFYELISSNITAKVVGQTYSFQDWVYHIKNNYQTLNNDLNFWKRMKNSNFNEKYKFELMENFSEKQTESLWLIFPEETTYYLQNELHKKINMPIHLFILAIFAVSYSVYRNKNHLLIDIESHGRVCLDDTIDISRLVGWFTSIFPICLQVDQTSIDRTLESVISLFSNVPNLGIAYGYLEPDYHKQTHLGNPEICYNYLGNVLIKQSSKFFKPSSYRIYSVRGCNSRVYPIQFSVKILNDNFICEISFFPQRDSRDQMKLLMKRIEKLCHEFIPASLKENKNSLVLTEFSNIGLLTYVPLNVRKEHHKSKLKVYKNILLTGATGYIGVHIFKQLLNDTASHIYCIIRGGDINTVNSRFNTNYQWYFSDQDLKIHAHRFTLICGDVSKEKFGLGKKMYNNLSEKIDAIYHFAANTRLLGDFKDFERENYLPIIEILKFSVEKKEKDFHYMSTLSVCGINQDNNIYTFSERDLFFGQTFQNNYERSKFLSEKLISQFIANGGRAFIYRSGNVTGNSINGKFQINAKDNRFIQFLNAIIRLEKLPSKVTEYIQLTPVDEVARAMTILSTSSQVEPGTFHIDNNIRISMKSFFDVLMTMGFNFNKDQSQDFVSLFNHYKNINDPILNLGHFWVMRPNRNVEFDHNKSLLLLKNLKFTFANLDLSWIVKFLSKLIEDNVLENKETIC